MRKHWVDNLRWVTVLLVLLYHVFYFYNNKGVFGGIGGFGPYPEYHQYQDVVMYILYPFFMPLLFILAGISSRYALEHRTTKEWFNSRVRKLLLPATLGLFVYQWITGYFNTHMSGVDVLQEVPQPIKYLIWAGSGTGPLWFIQNLLGFSALLLLIRKADLQNKFYEVCGRVFGGKAGILWILLLGVLFWLGEQTLVRHPRENSMDGLLNLYKPLFYLIPFMMGYFIFAHDKVQEMLRKWWIPLIFAAVAAGSVLIATTFGQDNTLPQYLQSPLNNIYGWLTCIALMGLFAARFDTTSRFAGWMTRSSYGLYIVHYSVIASFGYMMKVHTTLKPVAIYLILIAAVFTLSPAIYELLRRIPFVRWCVFGIKKEKR